MGADAVAMAGGNGRRYDGEGLVATGPAPRRRDSGGGGGPPVEHETGPRRGARVGALGQPFDLADQAIEGPQRTRVPGTRVRPGRGCADPECIPPAAKTLQRGDPVEDRAVPIWEDFRGRLIVHARRLVRCAGAENSQLVRSHGG